MTDDIPFDLNTLAAARRASLARVLADLDAKINLRRADLGRAPVLPLPGSAGEVTTATIGMTGEAQDTGGVEAAREAAKQLHALFAERRRIAAALRVHELSPPDSRLCEKEAVAWINTADTAERLLEELVPDPAIPRSPRLPRSEPLKTATAILRFRNQQPGRRIRRLSDLQAVTGVNATWLRHLLHTGCTRLQPPDPDPVPVVGVMLPVRLETRFRNDRLLLRVVPDSVWFARHDARASQGELDALSRYLHAVAADGSEPATSQAWHELVSQVGGARAAFLLRAWVEPGPNGQPMVRIPQGDELREEPQLPRIEGFPEKLQVWLARGGGAPVTALTLTVDRARLLADFPDPDVPGDRRWWESWDEALAVGLAGEVPLDGDGGDLDAVYVTGLGDGDPSALFRSHRDEGRLGTIPPGTATNSVDGRAASPLGDDPKTWWEVVQLPANESDRAVSASLTGDPDLLGNLPGPSEPHQSLSSTLVSALWPALWGFAGSDVWAVPDGTYSAGAWAPHALFPEGPFPTLRIGTQPYGLLPASSLAGWVATPKDPAVEAAMQKAMIELRAAYVAAAEKRGTVVGASTEKLLDLIAQVPTSSVFRHRQAWPLELWWLVLVLLGFGVPWKDIDQAWSRRHSLSDVLGLHPARRYGTASAPRRVTIPLVVPEKLPDGTTVGDVIRELVRLAFEGPRLFARTKVIEREFLHFQPDSLLLRLVIRSLQVAIGDVGRMLLQQPEPPPRPEPIARGANEPGNLERWIESTPSGALHDGTAEADRYRRVADALLALANLEDVERLERLLRATLDTASYRIDPWLVGIPARRLQDLVDRKAATFRLGAYGWVDAPRPGKAGPTEAGLLHAPSPGQALTATVLRDRAVNDPAGNRWDLDLTSRTVRDADRIAEHVRVGAHLAEALGREVERVVADRGDIARLRRDFPVRTEHKGRRTCDGQAVLAADPSALALDASRLGELDRLRKAMESYGDLLVAEAVHHVTEGRAEVAGAVMDAAAGLSRPPHLGLLRTPREGRAVSTSVVLALPAMDAPPLPTDPLERAESSPAALADAAAESFVSAHAGDSSSWTFEVAGLGADGEPAGPSVTLGLDGLRLRPADALSLTRTDLERLAAEEGARLLGTPGAACAVVGGEGLDRYERAARLVALLGRNPAGPDSSTEQADASAHQGPVNADLLARYTSVRTTAITLVEQLGAQVALTDGGGLGGADADLLTRLVMAARKWGVAPDPFQDPAWAGLNPAEVDDRRLVATAKRALELMETRVTASPDTTSLGPGEPSPAAALSRGDLVDALTTLVSPTGQVAITSRLSRADLPTLQRDVILTTDWLSTVAAVRESLARVEVHQLATGVSGGLSLTPWTNKPGDPWQLTPDARRMVVVYAAPALDLAALPGSSPVAVAAVDRFVEVIPSQEQTTGAAFGFNAPAARPPQSILLAVPPDLEKPMDDQTILDIVTDTRLLARARMARPGDLEPDLHGMLPAALLPAAGPNAVRLDNREG